MPDCGEDECSLCSDYCVSELIMIELNQRKDTKHLPIKERFEILRKEGFMRKIGIADFSIEFKEENENIQSFAFIWTPFHNIDIEQPY